MLFAHIPLPVENVIHTGDHVTVAYQHNDVVDAAFQHCQPFNGYKIH